MAGRFFDSNVLVYLASGDTAKADRAEALLADGGVVSVQVLNEVANVARRRMRMNWPDVNTFLAVLRGVLRVEAMTIETHEAGLALAARYHFPVYDAMIAASALQAGCDILWSEDFQHGMEVGEGLRIANPFRTIV